MRKQVYIFMNQRGGVGKTETASSTRRTLLESGRKVAAVDVDGTARLTSLIGKEKIAVAIDPSKSTTSTMKEGTARSAEELNKTFDPLMDLMMDGDEETDIVIDVGASWVEIFTAWMSNVELADLLDAEEIDVNIVVVCSFEKKGIEQGFQTLSWAYEALADGPRYTVVMNSIEEGADDLDAMLEDKNSTLAKTVAAWKEMDVDIEFVRVPYCSFLAKELAKEYAMALIDVTRLMIDAKDFLRAEKRYPEAKGDEARFYHLLVQAGVIDPKAKQQRPVGAAIGTLTRSVRQAAMWNAATVSALEQVIVLPSDDSVPEAAE